MSSPGWSKSIGSLYIFRDGELSAIISQRGELWEEAVYLKGKLFDFGTWDGREQAFRNAKSALKRCELLYNVVTRANLPSEDNDE